MEKSLMEEREEIMMFPSKQDHTLMKTQFLKPCVTSINGLVAELPFLSVSSSSSLNNLFSTISFSGFWSADEHFKSWALKMETLHQPTWRKAGIYEAIKASMFKITKSLCLVSALVEKWCPKTNTFVFPWGETTITLEDVMVLLGFSVLGGPVSVSAPLESSNTMAKLERVRQEIKSKDGRVYHEKWMLRFRDRGDDEMLEHEAFLTLWLSHFVFPDKSRRSVSRNVFPIAVRLARGERIALAPMVLASIYRDLSRIQEVARDKYSTRNLNLYSLFKLVQVWTWERFKSLRPEAKEIPRGESRISRWDGLQQKFDNGRMSFEDFDWRPYNKPLKNWNPLKLYVQEGMWITINNNIDEEFVAFARCVRSSPLVGIGFIEDYYPNRVARQFGLAQDLPGLVTYRSNFKEKEAWDYYNKSLNGLKLYMPSRLTTTSVTARYKDWWLKSVSKFLGFEETNETETCYASKTVYDNYVPSKVLTLSEMLQKLRGFPTKLKRCRSRRIARNLKSEMKKEETGDMLPLSRLFKKKLVESTSEHLRNKRYKREEDDERFMNINKDEEEDDNITIAERIKSREKKAFESLVKRSRHEENDSRIDQKDRCFINYKGEEEDDKITIAQWTKSRERKACESVVRRSRLEENISRIDQKDRCFIDYKGKEEDDNKTIAHWIKSREKNVCESLVKRSKVEDNDSKNGESVAPQGIARKSGEEDEEETRSKAWNKSSDFPFVISKEVVDDDDDYYEELKGRKLGIEELILELEASVMETKKNMAKIREWKTRRNHISRGIGYI